MPKNTPTNDKFDTVTDDWPDELPIVEAELELFERDLLDIITAMVQHG